MNGRQVSQHEVAVFRALRASGQWLTVKEVASRANVARRTADHHLRRFLHGDLAQMRPMFGGYLYRVAPERAGFAAALERELDEAAAMLGVE